MVPFGQRHKGVEVGGTVLCAEHSPGTGKGKCQGPEAGTCLGFGLEGLEGRDQGHTVL